MAPRSLVAAKVPTAVLGQSRWRASARALAGRPWLLLPFLALPAFWPFLASGLPRGQDTIMHLMRLGLLDYHVRHGTLFPRWFPELMLGRGYPVFNFYAPLTYYVAEALRLIGLNFADAIIGTYLLLILAAGAGTYLLARDLFGADRPAAALVAATAYMYAPYLLTNVFVRGALAETGAQAFLPWIFWSLRRLLRSDRPGRYVLPAALSLAGLALSHNVTLLFLPPAYAAFLAIQWSQGERGRQRPAWVAASIVLGAAAAAFFLLPLVIERSYLAEAPYAYFRSVVFPRNAWTWGTFLDTGLAFAYTTTVPFRLGLAQVVLAAAGALLAWRRDAEWVFWIGLAVLAGLGASTLALPIWLGSQILQSSQFPWRLLSLIALPLALLTGGSLLPLASSRGRGQAAALLLALILLANRPHDLPGPVLSPAGTYPTPAATAQLEIDSNVLGASGVQEFRPRWSQHATDYAFDPNLREATLEATPISGNAFALTLLYTSPAGGPLRFGIFYFPGWQVLLDEKQALAAYPSTNLGWLTVDLPPGSHTLQVRWAGTLLQHTGEAISLLSLAVLAMLASRQRGCRAWALLPLALILVGGTALALPRHETPLPAPAEPVAAAGLKLMGYRAETSPADGRDPALYVYPYWFVSTTPPASTAFTWQLEDTNGHVLVQTAQSAYFGTGRYADWPAGSVVRDAYELPLPPGLPAGTYRITVRPGADEAGGRSFVAGTIRLAATGPGPVPAHPVEARLGTVARLAGYDLEGVRAPQEGAPRPATVSPRAEIVYTLYWQTTAAMPANYHGFVQLVDAAGHTAAQQDQLPGPEFRPPRVWNPVRLQPDRYAVRIPAGTPGGLYWPLVGLYDLGSGERLPAYGPDGKELQDGLRLPPLKVIGTAQAPRQTVTARLGDLADFLGYDLSPAGAEVHPGDTVTLTLYYRARATTTADYTRFVHLADGAGKMAAQHDGPPQKGSNPTWSWTSGETITDRVELRISQDAAAGRYTLTTGFYDRAAGGVRLPTANAQGQALSDNQIVLGNLTVRPK